MMLAVLGATGFLSAIALLIRSLRGSVAVVPPAFDPFCPHCDYDLRGNVSGTCPECGTIVRPPPPAPVSVAK